MSETKSDLVPVLEQIEKEKGIKKGEILKVIEQALISAYKKHVGKDVNVETSIAPDTGEIKAFVIKKIVEEVLRPNNEISLQEAGTIPGVPQEDLVIDKEIKIPVNTNEFSRIAAQTAKQVIIQKIRESEKMSMYEEFKAKEGNIISGVIYRFIEKSIIVDLGKTEGILPYQEQVQNEQFKIGDNIRVLIVKVDRGPQKPKILLSRARPQFVKRLFEFEVPEIYEKLVEIKDVVRQAGIRTKIAVISHNPRVDPVGACVGVRGSRIKPIMEELRGEHIDLIPFSDDAIKFITESFSPAKIAHVDIVNIEQKRCTVIVPDNMLGLAIGKNGANVNLVTKLTGWQIDVKSETQKSTEAKEKVSISIDQLSQLEGIGPKIAETLNKAGMNDITKLASMSEEDLMTLQGVGEKTAKKIIESSKKFIEKKKD
jgi:N utilization substance protein A